MEAFFDPAEAEVTEINGGFFGGRGDLNGLLTEIDGS